MVLSLLFLCLVQNVVAVGWFKWRGEWYWEDEEGWYHYMPRRGWPEEGHNAWGWRQQPWNDQWQDDWDLNSHDYMPGGLPEEGRETQRERSPSPRHIPTSQRHTRAGGYTRAGRNVRLDPAPSRPHNFPPIPEDGPPGSNSQSSHMPAEGLPEEGTLTNALEILGDLLGRNSRYDYRGYRSQIRRQLKFRLRNMGIPIPEWLEDKGQQLSVSQFRDKAYQWVQALKAGSKVAPNMPTRGLPAEGTATSILEDVSKLHADLGAWLSESGGPVFETPAAMPQAVPPAAPPSPDTASPTECTTSDMEVEDPTKTKSEPPPSPRGANANGSLPAEGSLDATHASAVSSGSNTWTLVQPVGTAESTPADVEMAASGPMPSEGLPAEGTLTEPTAEIHHPEPDQASTAASFDELDTETVASFTLLPEDQNM